MSPGTKKALKTRFVEFEIQYVEAGRDRSTASVDYDLTDISETATNFNYIVINEYTNITIIIYITLK